MMVFGQMLSDFLENNIYEITQQNDTFIIQQRYFSNQPPRRAIYILKDENEGRYKALISKDLLLTRATKKVYVYPKAQPIMDSARESAEISEYNNDFQGAYQLTDMNKYNISAIQIKNEENKMFKIVNLQENSNQTDGRQLFETAIFLRDFLQNKNKTLENTQNYSEDYFNGWIKHFVDNYIRTLDAVQYFELLNKFVIFEDLIEIENGKELGYLIKNDELEKYKKKPVEDMPAGEELIEQSAINDDADDDDDDDDYGGGGKKEDETEIVVLQKNTRREDEYFFRKKDNTKDHYSIEQNKFINPRSQAILECLERMKKSHDMCPLNDDIKKSKERFEQYLKNLYTIKDGKYANARAEYFGNFLAKYLNTNFFEVIESPLVTSLDRYSIGEQFLEKPESEESTKEMFILVRNIQGSFISTYYPLVSEEISIFNDDTTKIDDTFQVARLGDNNIFSFFNAVCWHIYLGLSAEVQDAVKLGLDSVQLIDEYKKFIQEWVNKLHPEDNYLKQSLMDIITFTDKNAILEGIKYTKKETKNGNPQENEIFFTEKGINDNYFYKYLNPLLNVGTITGIKLDDYIVDPLVDNKSRNETPFEIINPRVQILESSTINLLTAGGPVDVYKHTYDALENFKTLLEEKQGGSNPVAVAFPELLYGQFLSNKLQKNICVVVLSPDSKYYKIKKTYKSEPLSSDSIYVLEKNNYQYEPLVSNKTLLQLTSEKNASSSGLEEGIAHLRVTLEKLENNKPKISVNISEDEKQDYPEESYLEKIIHLLKPGEVNIPATQKKWSLMTQIDTIKKNFQSGKFSKPEIVVTSLKGDSEEGKSSNEGEVIKQDIATSEEIDNLAAEYATVLGDKELEIQSLKEAAANSQGKITEQEALIAKLTTAVDPVKVKEREDNQANAEKIVQEMKKTLVLKEVTLTRKQQEIDDLNQRILTEAVQTKQERILNLTQENETLRANKQQLENDKQQLENDKQQLENDKQQLEIKNTQLQATMEAATEQIQKDFQDADDKNKKLIAELQLANRQKQDLEGRLIISNNRAGQEFTARSALEGEINAIKPHLENLKKNEEASKILLKTRETENELLQSGNDTLLGLNNKLKSENKTFQQEAKALQQENELFKTRELIFGKQTEEMAGEIQSAKIINEKLLQQQKDQEAENLSLSQNIESLRKKLEQQKTVHTEQIKDFQTLLQLKQEEDDISSKTAEASKLKPLKFRTKVIKDIYDLDPEDDNFSVTNKKSSIRLERTTPSNFKPKHRATSVTDEKQNSDDASQDSASLDPFSPKAAFKFLSGINDDSSISSDISNSSSTITGQSDRSNNSATYAKRALPRGPPPLGLTDSTGNVASKVGNIESNMKQQTKAQDREEAQAKEEKQARENEIKGLNSRKQIVEKEKVTLNTELSRLNANRDTLTKFLENETGYGPKNKEDLRTRLTTNTNRIKEVEKQIKNKKTQIQQINDSIQTILTIKKGGSKHKITRKNKKNSKKKLNKTRMKNNKSK